MITIEQLTKDTGTTPEEWHQHENGGGWVYKTAIVDKLAYLFGNARVYGNAWVSGDAWVSSPLYIQGSRHALTNCSKGRIQIGCHIHTFAEWKRHAKSIGKAEGYTDEQVKEYLGHIEHIEKFGK